MADDDATTEMPGASDPQFGALLEKLSESYHFDFREYKTASLERRIRARVSQVRADGFEAYAAYLDAHPDEHIALFNTILINVTGFFRDSEAWTALADDVIPRVIAEARDTRSIRVWSAGCSSGEEPYSVAILLAEQLGDRAAEHQIKIYGTDVDEDALAAARHGMYRTDQLKDLPDEMVRRYFTRDGHLWRVRRDLRRWCIFGLHNLMQAPPLSHIDVLVCRNVLIYFTASLQDRILSRFHYAVRDGGYLFLGRSESLLARSRLFAPLHPKWRIFQRSQPANRAVMTAPEARPQERAEPAMGMRAQHALEVLPAPVMVIDAAETILSWNAAA